MATSMYDVAAKRANPRGESSTQMERRMRMEKASRDAAKKPIRPAADAGMMPETPEEMRQRKMDEAAYNAADTTGGMKKGGKVKKYAKGGSVGGASKRADGIAQRGRTSCKMV